MGINQFFSQLKNIWLTQRKNLRWNKFLVDAYIQCVYTVVIQIAGNMKNTNEISRTTNLINEWNGRIS